MSLIKAIKAQLGLSVTPANNFTLDASADNGTMKLSRNSGQDIMTVDAAGKVAFPQGIDYPEPSIYTVTCTPENGAFGAGAICYVNELRVGNLAVLMIAWDIPDKGTGSGAVILGFNAVARGMPPVADRYWPVGAGRNISGKMLQGVLQDGYIAVFNYDNTGAVEAGYTAKLTLSYIMANK